MALVKGINLDAIATLGEVVNFYTFRGKTVARKKRGGYHPARSAEHIEVTNRFRQCAIRARQLSEEVIQGYRHWVGGTTRMWKDQFFSKYLQAWSDTGLEPSVITHWTPQRSGTNVTVHFTQTGAAPFSHQVGTPIYGPIKKHTASGVSLQGCTYPPDPPPEYEDGTIYIPGQSYNLSASSGNRQRNQIYSDFQPTCGSAFSQAWSRWLDAGWSAPEGTFRVYQTQQLLTFGAQWEANIAAGIGRKEILASPTIPDADLPYVEQVTFDWTTSLEEFNFDPWGLDIELMDTTVSVGWHDNTVVIPLSGISSKPWLRIIPNHVPPPSNCPNTGEWERRITSITNIQARTTDRPPDTPFTSAGVPTALTCSWPASVTGKTPIIGPPILID